MNILINLEQKKARKTMFYKSKDDKLKDSVLFRCECGETTFMEVTKLDNEDAEMFGGDFIFTFVLYPYTFWQKVLYLFKHDSGQGDLILTNKDMKELKKVIGL
jgi:hypothetical protein